jgi:hypothetical protein
MIKSRSQLHEFTPDRSALAQPKQVEIACYGIWIHAQSTDLCSPPRGSNLLASLWQVCSSFFAAIATAESGFKTASNSSP